MTQELTPKIIGLLLVVGVVILFRLRGKQQVQNAARSEQDFALNYQVSVIPIILSVAGIFVFMFGALVAATDSSPWIGGIVAGVGILMIASRYFAHCRYEFKPNAIVCLRGKKILGSFPLNELKGAVRIDHSGGVSLLGLETDAPAPSYLPSPSWVSKSLFKAYPKVTVVFSSEGGGVHAEAILEALQSQMTPPRSLAVQRDTHGLNVDPF